MECCWVQPSSHDGSVHVHSRARAISGTQVTAAGWDFARTFKLNSTGQNHIPEGSYCAGSVLYT